MPWSYVWGSGYYSVDVTNNAQLVYDNLINQGVTLEATCAIIGNWQYESGLNPGQWQHGYSVGDWGSRRCSCFSCRRFEITISN